MSLSQVLNVCPKGASLVAATGRRNVGRISTLLLSSSVGQQCSANASSNSVLLSANPQVFSVNGTSNSRTMSTRCVTVDNINPAIKLMEYAVRGPLVIRAGVIEKELEQGAKKPFTEVIRANIGDCHAMGQQPITFLRQVSVLKTRKLCCEIEPHLLSSNLRFCV
uniref:Alanine aminotransferase 2 n=1 Tax=Culex pipiens TaxID=7175 RepID=A0A8D8CGH6_CULPI